MQVRLKLCPEKKKKKRKKSKESTNAIRKGHAGM